ncbi:MAG: hypothetical protein K6T80_00385 [Firmicutes bacterium]|nr:hypothetical protein [Bacillota bacterium]
MEPAEANAGDVKNAENLYDFKDFPLAPLPVAQVFAKKVIYIRNGACGYGRADLFLGGHNEQFLRGHGERRTGKHSSSTTLVSIKTFMAAQALL